MSSPFHSDPGPSSSRPAPSILSTDCHVPDCIDTTSEFFHVLTAPYHPPVATPPLHRAQPCPDHAARCRTAINWTILTAAQPDTTISPSHSSPTNQFDQPIYEPHGRWAWTHGLSFDDPKQLLSLRKGAQCSASIDSGIVADKEIKYICRKWKMSKQKEWYGFYSELALYKSEEYLRPLQGDVVPHVIGVHIMPESVSMTMEIPHSSFWIESSPNMPDVLKERVIAAFEKIHAQGVLHGDPELRHMLIGADGKVMIIDFGMSRAIREHPSVGIERAEPEEFRLEMRKVKYKLDYLGAREKEGDKVDDYLRQVRRNKKISELWRRRAKGERVGPIPQYEEDPDEYELDPPVNAQDFQEDWITASDDIPIRVVVPGQTPEQVASHVQTLLEKIEEMCSTALSPSAPLTGHSHSQHRRENVRDVSVRSLPPQAGNSHTKDGTHVVHRLKRRQQRHRDGASRSRPAERCEDDLIPLSTRHIEGTCMRRDFVRHKHLKNTYISSLSSNPSTAVTFPSSIENPENPRTLRPEEYRKIQESRRQAMLQYSRAPKGILKRKRDEEDSGDSNNRGVAAVAAVQPPCKRLRFSEKLVAPSVRRRTPFSDSANSRRPRMMACSRTYRRFMIPETRPESVNFTLPSFRTLSTLVGSLMPWVHCQ